MSPNPFFFSVYLYLPIIDDLQEDETLELLMLLISMTSLAYEYVTSDLQLGKSLFEL